MLRVFSLIQPVIAQHVDIPVLTSPLIMIPIIHRMLKPDQSIIVVTASKRLPTNELFEAVGANLDDRFVVAGLDDPQTFYSMCMGGSAISYDTGDLFKDVVDAVEDTQNSGAVLLECTILPPFAAGLKQATGLPVFDFIACVEWMHRAVIPKSYHGFL